MTRPGAPDSAAATAGAKNTAAWLSISHAAGVGETADAVARVTGRSDDPQHGADARAQPGVGDDVVAARLGARPAVRRYGVSAALSQPWPTQPVRAVGVQVLPVGVPGAGGEGDVADGAGDAGHGGGALDGRGAAVAGAGIDVDALGVFAVADRDGRVGADDRVGGGEAPGARRAERARHQQSGGVGERDGEPDRDEGAGEGAAAGAQRLQRDAQHVRPPVRSGARRPARRSGRAARRRAARRP